MITNYHLPLHYSSIILNHMQLFGCDWSNQIYSWLTFIFLKEPSLSAGSLSLSKKTHPCQQSHFHFLKRPIIVSRITFTFLKDPLLSAGSFLMLSISDCKEQKSEFCVYSIDALLILTDWIDIVLENKWISEPYWTHKLNSCKHRCQNNRIICIVQIWDSDLYVNIVCMSGIDRRVWTVWWAVAQVWLDQM